jgi:hypothetical protein
MDPRTFLPPRTSPPLAQAPAPGDSAPPLPVALERGRPAVVAFLRHTGCPFAEQTLRLMREAAAGAPEVQWVAISHAPGQPTSRWCEAIGGAGAVQLASDPSRSAYAAWGLGRTGLGHFLGRRSLAAVGELARRGVRNRHPTGTRWQSAGAFALDRDGVIRWRLVPAHAGEVPDFASAVRSVR